MAWGGPNLQTLFVTTSRRNLEKDELAKQKLAGTLFVIHNMTYQGVPGHKLVFPNADEY